MKIKKWQKKAALLCSLMVLVGSILPAAAAEKEHSGKTWTQMKDVDYDYEIIDGRIERMAELVKEAEEYDKADQEQEVLELYQQFIEDVNLLETCYAAAMIFRYGDVENDSYMAREEKAYKDYLDLTDKILVVMGDALRSPYKDCLSRIIPEKIQEEFLDYQKMTDREKQLEERKASLVQEYDKLYIQEYSVIIDGVEWNFDNVYTSDADYEIRLKAFDELQRVKNEALSGIYQELIALNIEQAEINGYDNYLDFAMKEVYGREYSAEDVDILFDEIKQYARFVNEDLEAIYGGLDYEELEKIDSSSEKILDALEPYMGRIDNDMQQTYDYMRTHELVDIDPSSSKGEVGFTTDLRFFGEAYVFYNPNESYYDYGVMVHEFGHFYGAFCKETPALYGDDDLDVCEIQSQGLQMLFYEYTDELFGEKAGQAFNVMQIGDMMQTGIFYQAMISEFEMTVYRNPDMSVQEMNRLYARLDREYGFGFAGDNEEFYSWVQVPHIYQSPLYCVSYVVSALSALDLFTIAQTDREQALDSYMKVAKLPYTVSYEEAVKLCGLRDIFEPGVTGEILQETMDLLPQPSPYEEIGLYFMWVILSVSGVLTVAGVVTGIVVLCGKRRTIIKKEHMVKEEIL